MKRSLIRIDEQSLFVVKELFEKTGRFREDVLLFEDLELTRRLRRYSDFAVLNEVVTICDKKYESKNILRARVADLVTRVLYLSGYSQATLLRIYSHLTGRGAGISTAPGQFASSHL